VTDLKSSVVSNYGKTNNKKGEKMVEKFL